MYRIYKLSHYLGTRLVKTVVILARYSVYTNQYDFIEKIVTIENFIFLRLKSHFCDENHFRRKSHFCDESHFRPFYPFLRRKSQTVSTKVFATKVLAPGPKASLYVASWASPLTLNSLDSIVGVSGNRGYVRNTHTGEQFTVRSGFSKKKTIFIPIIACMAFTAAIAMLLR